MEISDVDVENTYVNNNYIYYNGSDTFKTTIRHTNFADNDIRRSLDNPQNFIVCMRIVESNCFDIQSAIIFKQFNNKVSKKHDFIPGHGVLMYIDPLKLKLYVNNVELSIPNNALFIEFIMNHINNNIVEYTFRLINKYCVTSYNYDVYAPYIHEIRVTTVNLLQQHSFSENNQSLMFPIFPSRPTYSLSREIRQEQTFVPQTIYRTMSYSHFTRRVLGSDYNLEHIPEYIPKNPIRQYHLDKMQLNSDDEYYCSLCQETINGGIRYNWKCCNKNICHECGQRSIGKQESKCPFCRSLCE